ncbi:MAG: phosphate transport system permease protein [Verrucomicrobiales bacterium]
MVFKNEAGEKVQMNFDDYSEFKKANPDAVTLDEHTHSYSGGGIKGSLLGTALLMVVCMTTSLFVGISVSIYLSEYANQGKFVSIVRLAILNLAGVPSIVFGLFGFAFFCVAPWLPVVTMEINEDTSIGSFRLFGSELFISFQGWGSSLLAGGLTLAIMVLPVIIAACEESLKAVPKGFREASCALGATKWQCIRTAVLPYAAPGILTASILGITRVAGETAPIMFTAAVALKGRSPFAEPSTDGGPLLWLSDFFTQSVQAMPYHIYTVSARIPRAEGETTLMQDGSVFVFLLLLMLFSAFSIWLRIHYRNKLKW